ncbi:MAG: septum formation initiator family protein [Lachnospiraceae bacterium]|nr:septum formation initiator family protein [Lachnospiraceae bacterium]MBQ9391395.1 septum formation initiator family protein [Lachnospiraceae bacterium]
MQRPRKRRAVNGRISFVIVVLFLIVAMSVAMILLIRKDLNLKEVEAKKRAELQEQQEIAQELSDKERYTQTSEYVENTAKNKLGLVREDETIFREK